ncbi:3-oxoacyl-[acyl-carrier-protein] reductase FabG-like [Oppia nitens]|uniref:3-oxoacyl-[acyl-carrier-protein] reductase FabG-like n=1 Tax=Oppia nitens TaxID=1686743 RepID=UPI0023DC8E8A|nr:3-oxoacyl-[acyl-carrier-protein] reductase FabG-like [Oppia nitens]
MALTLDFTDKVVLVTGSSSGIGEATVIMFAQLGAKVVVHGRNRQNVAQVAAKCRDVSPKHYQPLELVADVANEQEVDKMMDTIIGHYDNQLDVVVNNAGKGGGESNASLAEFDQFMTINLRSCYQICLRAYPLLTRSPTGGVIINNSSICSLKPFPHSLSYCVAKAGLDMLTRNLALLWGPQGIRVNAVNPGQIQTPIWENATGLTKEERDILWQAVCRKTPIGRQGFADDIAKAIVFLASNRDSGFTTGITMKIDGGFLDSADLIYN